MQDEPETPPSQGAAGQHFWLGPLVPRHACDSLFDGFDIEIDSVHSAASRWRGLIRRRGELATEAAIQFLILPASLGTRSQAPTRCDSTNRS